MTEDIYKEFRQQPGDNLLAQISATARDLHSVECRIAELEEALSRTKEQHKVLSEQRLPELMEAAEQQKLRTADGIEVELEDKLSASLPKEDLVRRAKGLRWLRDHGQGDIIKSGFNISFSRGEEEIAEAFAKELRERDDPIAFKRVEDVHHTTLAKVIRELLEKGVDVPLDVLGAYKRRICKITVKG